MMAQFQGWFQDTWWVFKTTAFLTLLGSLRALQMNTNHGITIQLILVPLCSSSHATGHLKSISCFSITGNAFVSFGCQQPLSFLLSGRAFCNFPWTLAHTPSLYSINDLQMTAEHFSVPPLTFLLLVTCSCSVKEWCQLYNHSKICHPKSPWVLSLCACLCTQHLCSLPFPLPGLSSNASLGETAQIYSSSLMCSPSGASPAYSLGVPPYLVSTASNGLALCLLVCCSPGLAWLPAYSNFCPTYHPDVSSLHFLLRLQ